MYEAFAAERADILGSQGVQSTRFLDWGILLEATCARLEHGAAAGLRCGLRDLIIDLSRDRSLTFTHD